MDSSSGGRHIHDDGNRRRTYVASPCQTAFSTPSYFYAEFRCLLKQQWAKTKPLVSAHPIVDRC